MATAYSVPYLPLDSPEYPQPVGIQLPLYKHQLRSLYRMRQIEARNAQENETVPFNCFRFGNGKLFGLTKEYISKGGVLCDAIGMGKTATILALICSEERCTSKGGNLIICPPHLLQQWSSEATKFVKEGELEIISGLNNYLNHSGEIFNRTIVLCTVDELLESNNCYYSNRTLFKDASKVVNAGVSKVQTELYRKVSLYIVGGTGSYNGPLWSTLLHFPSKKWTRVIFEEVQDLVEPGKTAQDCFTQLTWASEYVWLVTATPFPRGNSSAYANCQLLGFRRSNFCAPDKDVPVEPTHPLEIVKRKLYLRNHDRETEEAIADRIAVTNVEIEYPLTEAERLFYTIQREITGSDIWHVDLRKVLSHPSGCGCFDQKNESELLGLPLTQLVERLAKLSNTNLVRINLDISHRQAVIRATETSLAVIEEILSLYDSSETDIRRTFSIATKTVYPGIFSLTEAGGAAPFRIFGNQMKGMFGKGNSSEDPIIFGSDLVLNFVCRKLTNREQQQWFSHQMQINLLNSKDNLSGLTKNRATILDRFMRADEKRKQLNRLRLQTKSSPHIDMVEKYGSRIANLVKYISTTLSEQRKRIIVFSDWEILLRKSADALRLENIVSVIFASTPGSESKDVALTKFLSGSADVLMLCSRTTSSGINLQIASEVIFLDPPGSDASHGAVLLKQAMGRILRMGQLNAVKSIRLIASDTCDKQLYDEIDASIRQSKEVSRNQSSNLTRSAYVCEGYDLPIPELPPAHNKNDAMDNDGNNEVEIIAEISREEKMRKRLLEAEVIDISDSDEPKPPKSSRMEAASESAAKTIATSAAAATTTIVKVEKQKPRSSPSVSKELLQMAVDNGATSSPGNMAMEATANLIESSTGYSSPVRSNPTNPEVLDSASSCPESSGNTTSDEVLASPGSESTDQYSDLDFHRPASSNNCSSQGAPSCSPAVNDNECTWPTPDCWLCPLSKRLLQDAVVAADGQSYEREHIEGYMAGKLVVLSPVTGLQLPHLLLTPNIALKKTIAQMRK